MLLTFSSDWHIDKFPNIFVEAYKEFEGLLIIAGDFAEVRDADSVFFSAFENLFDINPYIYIVFICGNHEYYGNTIKRTHELIHSWIEERGMDRFYFLESDYNLFWNETLITGATLWYPDTIDSWLLQNNINDFSQIREFTPDTAHKLNSFAHDIFDNQTVTGGNRIWVIHHLPSYKSVCSRYKGDRVNCYFVDPEFEKLIEKHQPDFVIHGHTHTPSRYKIGKTWVLSNPRGYGKENPHFNPLAYILEI